METKKVKEIRVIVRIKDKFCKSCGAYDIVKVIAINGKNLAPNEKLYECRSCGLTEPLNSESLVTSSFSEST